MKKKKPPVLPKGWTLPALADRRKKARPNHESAREHARHFKERGRKK